MAEQYSKISPTAIFCARIRAKYDIPYSKLVLDLINIKYSKYIEDLKDYGNSLSENSNNFISFIEGRYYCLNDSLKDINKAVIVEIAAGLSTRGLEFADRKDVLYIETDIHDLIRIKEKIVNDIASSENLKSKPLFMSINPLKQKDIDLLGEKYKSLGDGKPLIVVHEGFLMYLDRKEKKLFRNNLKYLFSKYAPEGTWITTDLSRRKKRDKMIGKENIRNKIKEITKREFDYFSSDEEVKRFLKEGGFSFEVISNEKIVKSLIDSKKLESNKKEILNSSKEFRCYKINLN